MRNVFPIFRFPFYIFSSMRRRKTAIFFLILGISLSVLAVALNIGWILLNLREVALLVFGVIFFALIITGLILNTIFLVREIRRNEQHDAFINAVTHELKTPIASIKLYLETLKTRELPREKQVEFFDVMLDDNERLLGTVEQVLQAGRTREKQRLMNLAEIDLGQLISETISNAVSRRHLDSAAIRFSEPAEKIKMLGDRGEMQTALANLIDNAIKYSPNEPKINIKLRSARPKKAEIFVRDNGIGMARGDLKRVFKRFYRAQNTTSSTTKGTGLGLAIVQAIVTKHGGTVRAESKGEGFGTTIVMRLPKI